MLGYYYLDSVFTQLMQVEYVEEREVSSFVDVNINF